jgi:N-acetylneuraminic acid mutarotase
MKLKIFFSWLLTLFLFCKSLSAQWIQVADFEGGERDDLVAFTCGGRAFAGSGMKVGYQVTNDFYEYKPDINQWLEISNLPSVARQYAFSFSFYTYGCVYAGINQTGVDLKDGYLYSPQNNNWISIASYPGNGSKACASATLANYGYAGLGSSDNNTLHNDWWQYNLDSNTWLPRATFPGLERNLAACFESNGFIYVIGGIGANNLTLGDVWQYNPQNDSWLALSNMLTQPIGNAANCKVKSSGVMVGGYYSTNLYTSHAILLDAFNYTWSNLPYIPIDGARKGAKAFSLNDELYVTCGITSSNVRLKSTWKYNLINTIDDIKHISEAIQIYPNPANDFAEVIIAEKGIKNYSNFCLNTIDGQTLRKGPIDFAAKKFHLNTSDLPNGLYFIKLYDNETEITQKLLIYK